MYTAAVHFSCWEKSADWGGVFRKEIHFLTLFFQLIQKRVTEGRITVPLDEQICIPKEVFRAIVEECKEKFGEGFNKTYREMTFAEFYREVERYMEELMLIEIRADHVKIRPAAGKIYGKYPEDFLKNGGRDE